MGFVRLYSGDDGESHFEEMGLDSHPELTALQVAVGVAFRQEQPGYFSDWHNAPRRQYVMILAGQMEIGVGDGSVRRLHAGDVLLAEDLTGRGHTARVTGETRRVTASVRLAEG